MFIGVQVFPGVPKRLIEEAVLYEELGFDSIWVADHFHGAGRDIQWSVPELFTLLGAISSSTESISIGSCVVSVLKRDPAIVAQAALTLNQLSSGRFILGIGAGFGPDLRAFGIDTTSPALRVEEALIIIKGLFNSSPETPYTFKGHWMQLTEAFLNIPGAIQPPFYVAAVGPRMMALTGEYADGWLPFALNPDIYGEFLDLVSPRSDHFSSGLWLPMFIEKPGEDRSAEAEATGRLYLSMAPTVLQKVMENGLPKNVTGTSSWTQENSLEIINQIPAQLARSVTLCGSPDECVHTLNNFIEAGCTNFVLRVTDTSRREQDVRYFAKTVMPSLRQEYS